MAHQVTVKGQVTIPKKVREYLGIGPGSGVEFEVDAKGEVLLRKVGGGCQGRPCAQPFCRDTRYAQDRYEYR